MHACIHACMHVYMHTYTFTYSNPQVFSQGPEDREFMTPSFVIANVFKMRGWLNRVPSTYAPAFNGWPDHMTPFKNMSLKLFLHQALPYRHHYAMPGLESPANWGPKKCKKRKPFCQKMTILGSCPSSWKIKKNEVLFLKINWLYS